MPEDFSIDLSSAQPPVRTFGTTPGGEDVAIVQIRNGGAAANLMTWGASLQDFRLGGVDNALVLGSPDLAPYFGTMRYFGAMVGRVANRIAGGRAMLNGLRLSLDRNENGVTTLHGGQTGTGVVNWRLDRQDETSCRFALDLADGQDGFPGRLALHVTYALEDDGALRIDAEGRSDAPTYCNLAHHSYWNLDGSPDISGHRMVVDAERYLPVDDQLIPTGERAPVDGTRFDFRGPRPVWKAGDALLDHNFCLDHPGGLAKACTLRTPSVQLDVETTEPGLQVYEGAALDTAPARGHGGSPYGARAGVALEPQGWPDAPNRPDFPSVLLLPGDTYRQTTRFRPSRTQT